MTDETPEGSMSPGLLEMKLLLLANRIELEIGMFETDTAFLAWAQCAGLGRLERAAPFLVAIKRWRNARDPLAFLRAP